MSRSHSVQDAGLHRSHIGHRSRRVSAQRVADHVRNRCRWNCHDDHTDIRRARRLDDTRTQAGGDSCVADLVVSQMHPVAGSRRRNRWTPR